MRACHESLEQVLLAPAPSEPAQELDPKTMKANTDWPGLSGISWGSPINHFPRLLMPQGGSRRSGQGLELGPSEVPMCAVRNGPVNFGWDRPVGMPTSAPQLPCPPGFCYPTPPPRVVPLDRAMLLLRAR